MQRRGTQSTRSASYPPVWIALITIAVVVLVQLAPDLARTDFFREEGRRVVPAREMLETGNWSLPTIWHHPYLSKPPGMYWILAASFRLAGGVSELAARLPSLFATLLTAFGIFFMSRRSFGGRAGLIGALLFVLSIEAQSKGRLAEIEAPLACFVFFAVSCWWIGRRGSIGWSLLSGLFLGAAILCKGPAALLYFIGPALALALARRERSYVISWRFAVPLALGLVLAGSWVLMLFREIGSSQAMAHWASEISGQGGRTLAAYISERFNFVFGSLLAFAPASFVVLLVWKTPLARRLWSDDNVAFAFWSAAAGWAFFLLFPGTNVRYAFPGLPFVALLGGVLLNEALQALPSGEKAGPFARRLHHLATGFMVLGALVIVASVIGAFLPLGEVETDGIGITLAVLLFVLLLGILRLRSPVRDAVSLVLIPLLIGQLFLTQVGAATTERHRRKHLAAELDLVLPEGVPLHVGFWLNFNALLYVEHEVRYTPELKDVPAGSWLLLTADQIRRLEERGSQASIRYVEDRRMAFWLGERVLVRVQTDTDDGGESEPGSAPE